MPLNRRKFLKATAGLVLCGPALADTTLMATANSQAMVGDIVEVLSGRSAGEMAVVVEVEINRIRVSRNLRVIPGDAWIIYPEPV